jgi:adenylyltransferase/sulfurtransferase
MNIHIPTPLRSFTGGAETVAVPGATVAEVFTNLTSEYPALQQQLFNAEGKLRSFVNVYLNDEDLRYLPSKDATEVAATDELTIIPSIAGGTGRPDARASRKNSSCCSCCTLL